MHWIAGCIWGEREIGVHKNGADCLFLVLLILSNTKHDLTRLILPPGQSVAAYLICSCRPSGPTPRRRGRTASGHAEQVLLSDPISGRAGHYPNTLLAHAKRAEEPDEFCGAAPRPSMQLTNAARFLINTNTPSEHAISPPISSPQHHRTLAHSCLQRSQCAKPLVLPIQSLCPGRTEAPRRVFSDSGSKKSSVLPSHPLPHIGLLGTTQRTAATSFSFASQPSLPPTSKHHHHDIVLAPTLRLSSRAAHFQEAFSPSSPILIYSYRPRRCFALETLSPGSLAPSVWHFKSYPRHPGYRAGTEQGRTGRLRETGALVCHRQSSDII
ncbi:hypothetical protein TARUN_3931 [Trichoderma arundinaceum]|uniref:Uncharacterized protein n=1 Tax=Trichoderma arundinaceum TaxID=490622 RepID=A0A395NQL3_TRIAR|nr:hypothetical protein TARUN_3931 [Trichoderma arundinaceum]